MLACIGALSRWLAANYDISLSLVVPAGITICFTTSVTMLSNSTYSLTLITARVHLLGATVVLKGSPSACRIPPWREGAQPMPDQSERLSQQGSICGQNRQR